MICPRCSANVIAIRQIQTDAKLLVHVRTTDDYGSELSGCVQWSTDGKMWPGYVRETKKGAVG